MKFSKSEPDIIYQYDAPTKAETLADMKEIVPVIKDLLTKAIVENAIRPSERGLNYTPLGKWCIAPCRGIAVRKSADLNFKFQCRSKFHCTLKFTEK